MSEEGKLFKAIEDHINSLQETVAKEFEDVGKVIFNIGELIGSLERRVKNIEDKNE